MSDRCQSLGDLASVHAASRPDAVALRDASGTCTFGEWERRSHQVAQGLRAWGVGAGDRVAYLGIDRIPALEVLAGIAKVGASVMGLNWRLTERELHFMLEDGEAVVLFVDGEYAALAARLAGRLPKLRHVVGMDEAAPPGAADGLGYRAWRDGHSDRPLGTAVDPEAEAALMYTSGTTGLPKGVMLPHRAFFAVIRSMRAHGDPWIGVGRDDVSVCGMPLFHIGGLWWTATALEAGGQLVLMPPFSGPDALQLVVRERVTKACFVPAMLQVLLSEPAAATADFGALDHVVYGGSPIPKPFLQRAMEVFDCRFAQIYGLTETGNTAVCLRPEDHARDALLHAAGRPYPGVAAKILRADGTAAGVGEVGEICLHSPANMLGYWNRPDATAATLVDGWVHTGDAGHVDAEGYVFVSDRIKDMILYAGENVYPAEIESVLCEHDAVAQAAVIGIPDDRWGELVHAIVVLRRGARATADAVREHCIGRIADFKVPRTVEFADSLPRTPSGKIQKGVLRAPYWEGRERGVN